MRRGLASEVCRNDTSLASCRERWGLSGNAVDTGTTLLELMLGVAIMATLAAMAVPRLLETGDEMQARAAARYVAAQGLSARAHAARTGAAVGLRFEQDRFGYHWTGYVDGDGDGVRMADIARGVDRAFGSPQRLRDLYPAVRFELEPSVPPLGGRSSAGSGSDPIRLGRGDILTFSPLGTATSGTLYLRARSSSQYAVRIFGTTGRLRTLRYEDNTGKWGER